MHAFMLRSPLYKFQTFAGAIVIATVALAMSVLPMSHTFKAVAPGILFMDAVLLLVVGAIFFPVVRRIALALALAFMTVVLLTIFAHAADGSAPETVAQAATDTTKVTWAWGAVVSQWSSAIGWLILSGITYAATKIGGTVGAVLTNSRVQLLIDNGVKYAINAVDGAVAGKNLDVNVGNAVLAKALQYALDNSSTWLQNWAGGPLGIAKKIWAALNLGEGVSDDQLEAVVAQVTAK